MRIWVLILFLLAGASCREAQRDDGFVQPVSPWPFYASAASLDCDRNAVTVEVDGRRYAINGTARSLAKWPYAATVTKDEFALGALIPMGLELCRAGKQHLRIAPGAPVAQPVSSEVDPIAREQGRLGRSITIRSTNGFELYLSCSRAGGIDAVIFDFLSRPARIPDLRNNLAAITVNGARQVFEVSWGGDNGLWTIRSFPGEEELGKLPPLFTNTPLGSIRTVGISLHDAKRFGYPPGLLWEISDKDAKENAKFCSDG